MPARTTVIQLIKDNEAIPYGSLVSLCQDMGWKYNTIKVKKYPFEIEGFKITKEVIR